MEKRRSELAELKKQTEEFHGGLAKTKEDVIIKTSALLKSDLGAVEQKIRADIVGDLEVLDTDVASLRTQDRLDRWQTDGVAGKEIEARNRRAPRTNRSGNAAVARLDGPSGYNSA